VISASTNLTAAVTEPDPSSVPRAAEAFAEKYKLTGAQADGELQIQQRNGKADLNIDTYNAQGHFCMLVSGGTAGSVTIEPAGDFLFTGRGTLFAGCSLRLRRKNSSVVVNQEGTCGCGSEVTMAGEYWPVLANSATPSPSRTPGKQ
jgi:hypothetical protein